MNNLKPIKRQIVKMDEGQNKSLSFLYNSIPGRAMLKLLVRPGVSKLSGRYMNSRLSIRRIKKFVRKSNIDLGEYEKQNFCSYNDFFTRRIQKVKRPIDLNANSFIAPCDSKLTVYEINNQSVFKIKDSYYTVKDVLNGNEDYLKYIDGLCLIFRLGVDDYHRYCYIDNGSKNKNTYIPGEFHTVQPIALEHFDIYKRNSREYTTLHTENFGDVIQIEVGALMVGKIVNYDQECLFKKGEEKGKFEFGGSTIVLLIEPDKVKIDKEIMENTKNDFETIVKYGEKIGEKIC